MRYKKTHITLMETSGKYPNLRETRPHAYKIDGNEQPDKDKRILRDVTEYLFINPNKRIILINKIPEENLGKALDFLVRAHNLKKKLTGGEKVSKEEISGMTLEDLIKGQNLIKKIGGGLINYIGIGRAKRFLNEIAEE